MEIDRQNLSQMGAALLEHDAEKIKDLGAKGKTLNSGEQAMVLVAQGFNGNDIDQFHTQSISRISSVVKAASASGIDINAPVDNEPASHYLSKEYARRQISAEMDTSQAALNGLNDRNHIQYLRAYADGGVDFLQRDSKGRGFVEAGQEAMTEYAQKTHPRTLDPKYSPEDWQAPKFQETAEGIVSEMEDVKRASQRSKMATAAQSNSTPVKKKTRQSQEER